MRLCCNTKTGASLVLSRTCACAPMHSCVTDACLLSLSDRAMAVLVFLACARTLRLATDSHDHIMTQVRSKKVTRTFMVAEQFRFNAEYPSVAMSVEQASHKLQEQLQRVSAGHQAMHQELTTLLGKKNGARWRSGIVQSSTILMTDNEEALDDFPQKIRIKQPKLWLEHFARDQWTAACGITTKIPPICDGLTSCFKYEELLDDWLDLTVLEAGKRGPAQKNRLVGDAKKAQRTSRSRISECAEDGVKYFRDTLRPHYVKGAQNVFLWRFYLFNRARRRNIEMVDWIGKFSLLLKRLKDSWMDMPPLSAMSQERRERQYQADRTHLNDERRKRKLRRPCTLMNKRPETTGPQYMCLPTEVYFHSMIT